MIKSSNVGTVDRAIRMATGLILIVTPFAFELSLWANPVARWASIAVGLVFIMTALGSFCPLYRLLDINTCPAR